MTTCEVCGGPCKSKYSVCRENEDCRREYQRRVQRKYVAANHDAVLERAREGYDPEHRRERRRDNLEAEQARDRAYYRDNRERVAARHAAWYSANRDAALERAAQWQRDNPERVQAQRESYRRDNLEKIRARRKEQYQADRDLVLGRLRAANSTVQGAAELMLLRARAGARKASLPFDLTLEWAESELALALENGCPLLGTEIALGPSRRLPASPSIDRFRPELGYVQSNCWVISWAANDMKRDATVDFMQRVLAMADARFGGAAAQHTSRDPLSIESAGGLDPQLRDKARMLRAGARSRATARGLPFDLTAGWAERELAAAMMNGCPLLGIGIRLDATGVPVAASPSIDRFDPGGGYTQGNCWVISHRANSMKRNATPEFMRRILGYAATRFAVEQAA
jgi:hypothetical protein